MESYDFLSVIGHGHIGNLYGGNRFQPADGFRYFPFCLVAYFLTDDFPVVSHAEQHRAAFTVEEGAQRFHAALQLPGGLLELNLAAFLFGYQVLYDIEIVYLHRLAL